MAASNPPKGSVSSSSIKPVTRKAVRCQREVAWLVTQAAGRLVATTQDVNAPHRALCWQRRWIEYTSWNSPHKKTAAILATRTL